LSEPSSLRTCLSHSWRTKICKAAAIAGCGDLPSWKVTVSALLDQVFEGVETANAQNLGSMNLMN
jgi:hypothetical protein